MTKVKVISQSKTGRNEVFQNTGNNRIIDRKQFVKAIENPNSVYNENYYVKVINGIKTPVSKPDGNKHNNLG
jgi:hypothetical protein